MKGVILDMDGTIVDVPYDWNLIRARLGIEGSPILSHLNDLEEPEKSVKWGILARYEDDATQKARLKRGMKEFLTYIEKRGLKSALVTNNSKRNVRILLRKFGLRFDCVISRESGLWKPSGTPFLEVLRRLRLKPEECAAIGDSPFDVKAAEGAGIRKIFILSRAKEKFSGLEAEIYSSVKALRQRFEELLSLQED